MTSPFTYRLQLLLEQKEKARKEAEKEQMRQEQELQQQREILRSLEQREAALIAQRDHCRRELLTQASARQSLTGQEALERSEFVRAVGLDIQAIRNDVFAQQQVIEQCHARVEQAKARVRETRREEEILTKHRAKQKERFFRELEAKEELELDEIGNVLYTTRRRTT
jgi:flagellar biosynthesis chaperone FliJ